MEHQTAPLYRAHIRASGKVQGVFFRTTLQRYARAHHITGWTQNRMDGTLEAVFQGKKQDVDTLIQFCHQGPAMAHVEQVMVVWETPDPVLTEFTIRSG